MIFFSESELWERSSLQAKGVFSVLVSKILMMKKLVTLICMYLYLPTAKGIVTGTKGFAGCSIILSQNIAS